MSRRRNYWPLLPGGRLTFWRRNRRYGIPAAIVFLGRTVWVVEISLGRHHGWRPFSHEVICEFGPFSIARRRR